MVQIACPNCRARYEVPAAALGTAGRDVTCSSCGEVWHALPEVPRSAGIDPAQADRTRQRAELRQMMDEVQSPVRAPAAAAEEPYGTERWGGRSAAPINPPRQDRRGPVEPDDGLADTEAFMRNRQDQGPRGRDIDAISTDESRRKLMKQHKRRHEQKRQAEKRGSGAGYTGFLLVVLVSSVLVGLYALHPQIIARAPETEPALRNYVAVVDEARVEIEAQYRVISAVVAEKLGSVMGDAEG